MKHPAKFSERILDEIRAVLDRSKIEGMILDPFAGTGRVHALANPPTRQTVGVEIEPEWAYLHPDTIVGNALALPFPDNSFDAIVTSPCYGNRMADNDPRDSCITYRSRLGRPLSTGNLGSMQWGHGYQAFHAAAWRETLRVLRPYGTFVLNISDHVRDRKRQTVSGWHVGLLQQMGCQIVDIAAVGTPRMRRGQNHEARVDAELVVEMVGP